MSVLAVKTRAGGGYLAARHPGAFSSDDPPQSTHFPHFTAPGLQESEEGNTLELS